MQVVEAELETIPPALAVLVVGAKAAGMLRRQLLVQPILEEAVEVGEMAQGQKQVVLALLLSKYPTPTPQHFQAA